MRRVYTVTIVSLTALWFTCAAYVRRRHRANLPSSGTRRNTAAALRRSNPSAGRWAEALPADRTLKIELGRAYLYNRQDDRAMHLFREVLREEPSNRLAKIELARALGYQRDYEASNVLYHDLLDARPLKRVDAQGGMHQVRRPAGANHDRERWKPRSRVDSQEHVPVLFWPGGWTALRAGPL